MRNRPSCRTRPSGRAGPSEACARAEQTAKQRLFMDALYVVANVGYDKEVRAVFSLIRGTWTVFRLWSVIINRKIKRIDALVA